MSVRKPVHKNRATPFRKVDVNKLKDEELAVSFEISYDSKLHSVNINDLESSWAGLRHAIYESVKEILGYVHRKKKTRLI